MQGILYEEASFGEFVLVTCILGGWAAWMTGKSCAQTWRPYSSLVVYLLLLSCAVRFIHYALFEGTLLTLQYYIVDSIILIALGTLGFRYTRTNQMAGQYHWLYEKTSALTWKSKA